MQNNFLQRKKSILSKIDKSHKSSWDGKIRKLCGKINSDDNYYTTSSCSGRIVLMIEQEKKGMGLFLKSYHELISFEELKKNLAEIVKNNFKLIKFKMESCILHVACRKLKNAEEIYEKAKLAGWKKSGIISTKRSFVAELISTERLEFPIINKKKILVDDEFLKLVVKGSNDKLKRSWEKIKKLEKFL